MELRRYLRVGRILLLATAVQAITAGFGVSTFLSADPAIAAQSVPYKINFQGRLTDNSGNALSDGFYNVKFRLWTLASGGANQWQGDRIMGASDNRVQVTNGLFNIQFGDTAKGDPAITPALFNTGTGTLYLEVEMPTPATATCAINGCAVFTEGAMTPRQPLASSPYAINADALDGLDSAAFGQLSAVQSWTDTNTFSKTAGAALALTGTAASAGAQLQFGSVAALSGGSASGTYLGANPAAYSGDLINFQINNAVKLKVDNTGNLTLGTGAVIAVGSSTGVNTSCTGGQVLQNQSLAGGIVTGGTCGAPGGGANQQLGNLTGTVAVNLSLLSASNNTLNLGSAANVWQNVFTGNLDAGTTTTALTIGTAATTTALTVGRAGLVASVPGGLTTTAAITAPSFTGAGAVGVSSGGAGALTLTSASGTVVLGSATVQRAAAALTLDVQNAAASTLTVTNSNASFVASLSVEGGVGIGTGQLFSVGATNGATVAACTSGQYLSAQAALGGLVTGGSCATNDFQTTYANSSTPATVNLNTTAKDFAINATDQATDPNILFNLQCATCSAGAGRFAVQDNAVDILTVNPTGSVVVAPTAGQNLGVNLGAGSSLAIAATAVPTVDQVTISNTGQPVTAAGVSGLNITYVGGAIGSGQEASAQRIDVAAGSTNPSTWNGLRIASTTGAGTGVAFNGIKLEGPAVPAGGTETGLNLTTGWDIGVNIQSGGIQLTDAATVPTAPTAGLLKVYSRTIAGRSMLVGLGSSGIDYAYQPSLFQQNVFMTTPGASNSATLHTTIGGASTSAGTLSAATTTEAQGYMGNMVTTNTAGSPAGIANSANQYYRGNLANGADGFFYFARIFLPDTLANYTSTTTGARMFFGLSDQTMNVQTATDAPGGNYVGISFSGFRDNATGTFKFMSRDNAATTNVSTGVTLAVGKTYDIYVYSKPRDGTNNVYWRIENQTDGIAPVEGSKNTNMPVVTTSMKAMISLAPISNAARNIRYQRMYVETDR